MINIEGNNKLHDIYRLLWYIIPLVATFALGYLFANYSYEQEPISCDCKYNVTCSLDSLPPVIIKCDQPKTWV
jgi:hypothetical protein